MDGLDTLPSVSITSPGTVVSITSSSTMVTVATTHRHSFLTMARSIITRSQSTVKGEQIIYVYENIKVDQSLTNHIPAYSWHSDLSGRLRCLLSSLSPETLLLNNSAVCRQCRKVKSLEKLHSLHAGCKLLIFIGGPFEKSSRCDNSTPVTSTSLHVLCTRAGPNTREDYARDSLNTISDYTTPALLHTQNVHLTMTICQAGGSSLDRWMSKQL